MLQIRKHHSVRVGFGLLGTLPLLLAACSSAPVTQTSASLPSLQKLPIDPSGITVSGISSGGFMATQLHLAHSTIISGAAIIAGGIYDCAEGSFDRARQVCMKAPADLSKDHYLEIARKRAASGAIDPLENLKRSRVFIFAGTRDKIILPQAATQLKAFYDRLVPPDRVKIETSVAAAHGYPTSDYGRPCGETGLPWLLNCGYDTAGQLFTQLYGKLQPAVAAKPGNLRNFQQSDFLTEGSQMHPEGFLYIPSACQSNSAPRKCRLHIALHGCLQNQDVVKDAFRAHAGLNEWAEANRIVVLYPSATSGTGNPNGCWDWWGYTGADYAVKSGKQVRAIKAMIDQMVGASDARPSSPDVGAPTQ